MTGLCVLDHGDDPAEQWIGLVCKRHRRRMDDDAAEIAALIIDTQRIVDGGAPQDCGPQGNRPKKRADPPAPGDIAVMALYDRRNAVARIPDVDESQPIPALPAVIASWVLLVAEERPLTATLPASVLGQLELLRRHHDWLAARPCVDDYLLELGELRRALAAAVHDRRYDRRGFCRLPSENGGLCNGLLIEENGTRVVRCTGCGAQWVTDQELARLAVSLESA
jgi:hypothetical protein